MTERTSLVEQKKLQWAKEREEMDRLGVVKWETVKPSSNYNRTHIRTYSNEAKLSLGEIRDRPFVQHFLTAGHYGSTVSLKSLTTENFGSSTNNPKCLDNNDGRLINLQNQVETSQVKHRSPSLPPIFNKKQQQYFYQLEQQQRNSNVGGLQYQLQKSQKQEDRRYLSNEHRDSYKETQQYGSGGEEREGETSGYASDSVDVPQAEQKPVPVKAVSRMAMTEKTWQNPYCITPESSLPPSRRVSPNRISELNRSRWGVWGEDTTRGNPPPPSWLSRLGQSSQVLLINHDSASSPDSSTTGSTGSDKVSYLRGQNIPMDTEILQEREIKRQKALELQNAIKQQLEEKDRQRKEEKERRMREEMLEDERIQRERESDKKRFEKEQRIIHEKEKANLRKTQAMREVLETAERLAKEERKSRRKREEYTNEDNDVTQFSNESKVTANVNNDKREEQSCSQTQKQTPGTASSVNYLKEKSSPKNIKDGENYQESGNDKDSKEVCSQANYMTQDKSQEVTPQDLNLRSLQVPVNKDVTIVLSGRLENPEILNKTNLQVTSLVMTSNPRRFSDNTTDYFSLRLNTIVKSNGSPDDSWKSTRNVSSTVIENRLLTPSKYRMPAGRDFGTQTGMESDVQELRKKLQDQLTEQDFTKNRKDVTNTRRNVEKSNNVGLGNEILMKTFPRFKSQPRATLDSRPRWNANRPGTRYRTQSEKDPHYQRRLRLRRRQMESSDEGSRSPSPDRRKSNNGKSKRNTIKRKAKSENYDADLSMDSLNSIVSLRIDKDGKINIEECAEKLRSRNNANHAKRVDANNSNIWCGHEILSKLLTLKSGLLTKQIEWDTERCLVSPAASEIF
ncbi:histone-lysine N-methyltransferase, H3 lysine-79 specific [Monomorium pharaonis]|uniref:histone-lysine N-methyltransferase, H3 lysine-79 specific n=1 Tax=Monomorium pharaonis TaxID=307658 RepID=UPI00063FC5B8|nr:histone-lysine N-methyltransferase, H3 lysine-79 specific [Monomorium pharaonis]